MRCESEGRDDSRLEEKGEGVSDHRYVQRYVQSVEDVEDEGESCLEEVGFETDEERERVEVGEECCWSEGGEIHEVQVGIVAG